MIQSIFVYGTLKRGQCRARFWPVEPLSVCEAWTLGTLYDRSDYPAMTAGEHCVLGELWRFSPREMPGVLKRIDQVEGTNQPGHQDWYLRVTVATWSPDGRPLEDAFVYYYANDPVADGFALVQPKEPGSWVSWPGEMIP
jgi:gamma-glutamylcyclotransferase (GGCT)/AIG2-like uncharacterized protein YtfP